MIQFLSGIFGTINPPPGVVNWAGESSGEAVAPGLILFVRAIVRILIVIAGLYATLNIILAGYGFLSASDDPKKIQAAWAKIWQSIVGLLVVAASFILAAIIGYLLFGNPMALIYPQITGPD